MTPSEPFKIVARFVQEIKHIVEYTDFVTETTEVRESDIRAINKLLAFHELPTLPQRERKQQKVPLSHEELRSIVAAIESMQPAISESLDVLQKKLIVMIESGQSRYFHTNRPLMERISTMAGTLMAQGYGEDEIVEVENELYDLSLADADGVPPVELRQMIRRAIEEVNNDGHVRNVTDVCEAMDRCRHIKFVARLSSPDAEINILRQSFILLMTAFDAAIFDLVRLALQNNFFTLISRFDKKGTISMKDMAKYSSLDDFRDKTIEQQLKSMYVKDLLRFLKELNVNLHDRTKGHSFGMLMELVQRRNLHVHNRGYVDARYMELDEKSTCSKDNLKPGDMASISQDYWRRANQLAGFCVSEVAKWVREGASDQNSLAHPTT